jgi:hypothetical protein
LLVAVAGAAASLPAARVVAEDIATSAVARISSDLQFLSSDELEGRNTGSEGIARAGEFIAQRFAELGLNTQLFDGTPFQEFTIPGPPGLGAPERNTLQFTGEQLPSDLPQLVLGENFTPLSLGSNGSFSGGLVFAGFGITAPELGYDDYANVDVAGKVVIVLRKEPQQNLESSKFEGTRNSQHAYFSAKEVNAAFRKAAALILVNDRITAESAEGDQLLGVTAAGAALTDNQIPTFYCLRSVVDPLIQKATGKTLTELELAIDEQLVPQSVVLDGIEVQGETLIEQTQVPARNVIGLLPGKGALAEEYVVIGAHYDHVGMGGEGSLAPGTIAIHNGADDNASGTTAMLEVARRMAADGSENRRSIAFMAFTAEEKGLLGSKYYVRNPRFPLENTVAMLNMDMVGRLTDNVLTVYGTGTADTFDGLIDRLNETTKFDLDKQPAGFGPSDHSSFYEADIPVFHFFTGLHNQYHRPSDDFELINLEGISRIVDMVTGAAKEISTAVDRPALLKNSAYADVGRRPNRPARARAIIGVQLDRTAATATLSAVSENGPAAQAGLQTGDTILSIDQTEIPSTAALTETLSGYKPGDTIKITVLRDGEMLEVEVKLGSG